MMAGGKHERFAYVMSCLRLSITIATRKRPPPHCFSLRLIGLTALNLYMQSIGSVFEEPEKPWSGQVRGLCHIYRDCNSAAYNSGLLYIHRYFSHCNYSTYQAAKRMTSRLHLGSAPSLDARERPTTFIHQCPPPRLMPCALRVLKAPQPCIPQGTLLRQTANSSPLVLACEASGLTTWQCETREIASRPADRRRTTPAAAPVL